MVEYLEMKVLDGQFCLTLWRLSKTIMNRKITIIVFQLLVTNYDMIKKQLLMLS